MRTGAGVRRRGYGGRPRVVSRFVAPANRRAASRSPDADRARYDPMPDMTADNPAVRGADLLRAPPPIDKLRNALFLDLDGTLAEIEPTPDRVAVGPAMRAALAAATAALDGRVAIVSGRSLPDLDRLVGLPSVSLAGVHGLETRDARGIERRAWPSAGIAEARRRLAELASREPRLLVEDKGLGIAVHFRLAPDLAGVAEQAARSVAEAHGLVLQPGKMVFEVRDPGADKGDAVRSFMKDAPFQHARPIFVGDDATDECAFIAAAALGGHGILVGPPRRTSARYALPDVTAVGHWLAAAGGGR